MQTALKSLSKTQDSRAKGEEGRGIPFSPLPFLCLVSCVFLVSCVLCLSLSAQEQDRQDKGFVRAGLKDMAQSIASIQGNRWALLIGIADYPSVEGFEIQKLKAPVKDVNALAAFLKDPKKGGLDADHVFTLTDEQATKRGILTTFNDIAKRAAPEDMVIFYFSGHGARLSDSETTYLVPYDHDLHLGDMETTCINFDDLAEKIRKMEASKVVVILDACHSTGVKPKGAKAGATPGIVKCYLEAFQASEGRAMLLSSNESEVSWETEQYGVFTHFLLEGLDGKADKSNDGVVTFEEVANYVEEAVPKYTRENFPRPQQPMRRYYDLAPVRGDIPLAINWPDRDAFRQRQQDLRDERTEAILRAGLKGLDQTLKEFSLETVKSAYRKALDGESPTERELMLLKEIDALKNGTIKASDYITLARVIYKMEPVHAPTPPALTQLQLTVTPSDAKVTLTPATARDRVISPSSPNVYKVEQGRYYLSVKRPGYAPDSRELALDQQSETLTVTLERLMGTLQLQVDPSDATVMVTPLNVDAPDSEVKVSNPIRVQSVGERRLPVGTYRVLAEKEGYESEVKEPIEIDVDVSISVKLTLKPMKPKKPTEPEPATIAASDLPVGTRVFVDGEPVALPREVPPGTHRVRLERDGFQPYEVYKALKSAQVLPLNPEWVPVKASMPPKIPGGVPTVFPTPSYAQRVRAGLKAAFNAASFYTLEGEDTYESKPGFCAGGFIIYNISDTFAIQAEFAFTMKGAKAEVDVYDLWEDDSWDTGYDSWEYDYDSWYAPRVDVGDEDTIAVTMTLNYLEIPILAKITIPSKGIVKPNLFFGPAIATKLKGTVRFEYLGEEAEEDIEDLKNTDIGLVLGAGIDVDIGQSKLMLDARVTVGLTPLQDYELFEDEAELRNSTVSITIGYSF